MVCKNGFILNNQYYASDIFFLFEQKLIMTMTIMTAAVKLDL